MMCDTSPVEMKMHALELILAFQAWATARPELETRLASESLEKEMDAVAAIEAEQGPYSFDIATLHQETEFPRSDACAPRAVCCQYPRRLDPSRAKSALSRKTHASIFEMFAPCPDPPYCSAYCFLAPLCMRSLLSLALLYKIPCLVPCEFAIHSINMPLVGGNRR